MENDSIFKVIVCYSIFEMFIMKTQKRILMKFILLRVYVQRPCAPFVMSQVAQH